VSGQLTNSSNCEPPSEHDKKLRLNWPLLLILVLFVILGCLYNLITPIFEKPDEPKHYAYVKYVADGRGLPLFATDERPLWRQEATQGPLFYTLAALGTFWIDDSDFEVLIRENPHYLGGQGAWGDNSNRFVHTDREAFPYRGATLAVRVARFIALFIGAIAVAATYGIARIIFPARPALAVGAAALVAFNPMFLFISSSVSNDSTVAAASALTVLAGLRALRASPPTGRHFLALGLAWSLAVLAKSSALALGPWIGLILIGTGWREKSIGSFLRRASIVGGLSLLLAGWWYASTWVIHGDLLGTATHAARFGRRDPMPTVLQLLPELEGLEESFWALFGWRNLPVDERLYVLFAALDRMALLGWAILLVRQVRKRGWTRHQWLAVTLTWLWFSLALATVMRWMQLSTWGNTGRLLYSGLSAIALLLALGWSAFLPDDKSRYLLGALTSILLVIAAILSFFIILFIGRAKKGKKLFIRRIAGLEAVDEAVGRATEMGKSVLYVPGIQDLDDVQTIAGITILGSLAKTIAKYDTKLDVPVSRSLVLTAARETVKQAYLSAGRPDAYSDDIVHYITDEQFGYVAALDGIMVRDKPAACFYLGSFFAESLILAETGNSIGAIQVAGTAQPAQLPFFVAACDYTLIGEELFAASAYLSKEPRALGSLKGADAGKVIALMFIGLGVAFETLRVLTGSSVIAKASDFIIRLFSLRF